MGKTLDLKAAGLWTAPNDYTAPEGAWDVGDNVVIDQGDLAEPRRGFEIAINNADEALDGFPLQTLVATQPNESSYNLLTYRINRLTDDGRLLRDDRDTITGDNRFLPPAGAIRPRMLNWGKYIYVTSEEGIKRYSYPLNTSVPSGIPQGLDLVLTLEDTSGFLTSNQAATVDATVTDASSVLTLISDDDIASFFIGQYITGNGIVPGTKVQDVSLSVPVVIHDAELIAGDENIEVASDSGIVVGQIVTAQGLQNNSRVVSISGAGPFTVELSLPAIETATGQSATFRTDNTVTMDQNADIVGGPSEESLSLSNGSQVAYRLVWGLVNENEVPQVGAPSAFTAIANTTGGTRNVRVNATVPPGITTDNFWQLYRSVETPTSSIVPADQMQLVAQGIPSSGDIAAGFIEVLDQTPNSLKGESLYTGTDVEGINQSNYAPPTAADMCEFRGYILYGNYTLPHQLKLIIDGVGSPNGVQVGDEITIQTDTDSFVLTGAAAEDILNGEFEIFSGGTPAQNIADTAASFIRVLNRYLLNDICIAYLLSGPNDLPGQILLEARPGVSQFTVEADLHGDAWTPNIDAAVSSEAENVQNGILISKPQEPEAVPRANRRLAGGIGNRILRMVPLRDYVIVFTVGGVFRLTGQALADFQVEPFDPTVQLVGPETAVALGNECWALSTQGAVSISDGGVRIRSGRQINNVLQALIQQAPNALRDVAFAVGYESNQRYILSLPASEGDTVCTQQYCYNYITEKWTRWTRNCTAGYIHPLDGLFLGNGNNPNVVLERKNGTFTDYVDESIFVQITAADGFEVNLNSVDGLTVGDVLWQEQSGIQIYSEIVEVDFAASSVTVANELTWTVGTDPEDTRVLQAIPCVIQWKPMDAGDPTEVKQHSEGQLIFRRTRFLEASIKFATDISSGFTEVPLLGQSTGSWGLFPWGQAAWGGVLRPRTLRFYIPQDKQYAGVLICRLEIRSGYSNFQLEGGSIALFDIGFELGGKAAA